jgi:23S rRNA (guanine745-N1)-methyltransferase
MNEENKPLSGFSKIKQLNLNYRLAINNPQIVEDLINMTPFAWKFNPQKMLDLLAEKTWEIECDFNIEVYQKE